MVNFQPEVVIWWTVEDVLLEAVNTLSGLYGVRKHLTAL